MDNIKTLKSAGVILAYPLAFAYLKFFLMDRSGDYSLIKRFLLTLFFILINEIIVRGYGKRPTAETYFWYGIMGAVALTSVTGISEVVSVFAIHLCALYVAVVSCGILYEGRTGSFVLADLLNAGVFKAFTGLGNIFKDISAVRGSGSEKHSGSSIAIGILSVIFMIPIFFIAVVLLCGINTDFDLAVTDILNTMDVFWVFKNMHIIVLAFPLSLYLYGMVSQSAGSTGEKEKETYGKLVAWRQKCHKLAPVIASLITGSFVFLYVIFFAFEGSYLFSAFVGKLPEAFTAAEYARRGFFELTGIMTINMLVFVIVSYLIKKNGSGYKLTCGLVTALMSESILFAVISFSKLCLYYSRFGYTPKRLLAMWGTLIFAAGAVMVIASIFKRKDMSRVWIYFTTISFVAMNVLSSVLYLTL